MALNLSATVGPAISGLLATRSYLSLFIADAVISLISASIVFLALPETRSQTATRASTQSMGATFKGYFQALRDRVFILFVCVSMLSVLVYMNLNTTLGVYLRDNHAVSESGYGLLISANALLVVLLQFPITKRIESHSPMLMMAFGTLLYAIGFAM